MSASEKVVYAPGVYDISNTEYHASTGISRSAISELQKSPLHYWMRYLNPDREKTVPTKQMILGTAVHTLVLEPELFEKEFAIFEKFDAHPNTTIARNYKADFYANNSGKTIIDAETKEQADKMAQAVLSHRLASQLLKGAVMEKSIYWLDEETQLLCKARPDVWNDEIKVLVDLKTANDSTREAFMYSICDQNYHIQAAMQIDGVKATTGKIIDDFSFIVVQSSAPHKPYIYRMEDDLIEHGRQEYKNALQVFKKCIEKNHWSLDRECVMPVFLKEYQKQATFYKLMEIYQ